MLKFKKKIRRQKVKTARYSRSTTSIFFFSIFPSTAKGKPEKYGISETPQLGSFTLPHHSSFIIIIQWENIVSRATSQTSHRHRYLQLAPRSTYAINSTNLSVLIILEDSGLLFICLARLYVTNLSLNCDSVY